ncbi:hypothetical protein NE562_11540 [Butyricicoccus faecihominis]|uniref:phage tail tube protein n=1 Tax=Butyricicoccus faecihominis TaxID=1712515 RepID=UPI00247A15FE|nr:hypothetical protein [Butyricicoccus faecihominis]MCQ5130296.1 hypothetical protein [Butyricicoccus faecihominis]
MAVVKKSKIKRKLLASFLNTGTEETPVWSLIGDGVTEQTISYNPQTSDETYINQDTGVTDVENYKPTVNNPMTAIKGDPVFEFVDDIRIKRKVLDDCVTDVLFVYLYKEATEGAYPAERNKCGVQVDDFGGAGGESTKLNFSLNLRGDPVHGTFNPETKTFTEEGGVSA